MSDFAYIPREDGIHQFIFRSSKRAQVDEFLIILEKLLRDGNSHLFLYIDLLEGGLPPMKYTTGKLRELFKSLDTIPQMYAAYLYDNPIITVMLTILDTFRTGATRKLFKGEQEEGALQWLHEQQERVFSR